MNLRDLHYFKVLAEVNHFGEAARRCFVSQPTLSMQIKKLEDTLGVTLFERSNKHVFLTDQGQELLQKVKKILILVDEMKELARYSHNPYAGNLRLGVIPTVGPYLLPKVLSSIKEIYPELNIWLVEEQTHRLVSRLEGGELDAAIMALPVAGNFVNKKIYEEAFYFACAYTHPFADYKSISVEQLHDQQVMLLQEGHCMRDQAMAVCNMAKANEIADFTATSLETLRLMVQEGLGVTLLPALAVLGGFTSSLSCIPFRAPTPTRTLSLFWRPGTPKEQCLLAIAKQISQLISLIL